MAASTTSADANNTDSDAHANTSVGPDGLLTEEQKRANHIASEHRRRNVLRDGFQRLVEVVPALVEVSARSEAIILQQTVLHVQHLLAQRQQLRNDIQHCHRALHMR